MMKIDTPHNLLSVFRELVKYTKWPVDVQKAEKYLLTHPEFPSLSCLSDILDECYIYNLAVRVHPMQLKEINYPCIAHCRFEGHSYFVLLKSFKNDKVDYFDSIKGNITESAEGFNRKWGGVILLLTPNEKLSETADLLESRKTIKLQRVEKSIAFIFITVAVVLGLGMGAYNAMFAGAMLVGITGLLFSIALLASEFGSSNSLINQLCNLSEKTSCKTVVGSTSKVFGWLSWAEIGVLYFAGSSLSLLLFSFVKEPNKILGVLGVLNLLALPYTLFSVYYQARVAKKWCTLCLGVQLCLWGQFFLLQPQNILFDILSINLQTISFVGLSFILPVVLWFLFKPMVTKNNTIESTERQLSTFQRDSRLFMAWLDKQPHVEVATWDNEIALGNPEAPVTITLVSNPFCGPCARAHEEIEKLLAHYSNEIKVIFRFTGSGPGEENERNAVIKQLISLSATDRIHQALSDWYALKDYKTWVEKYSISLIDEADATLQKHIAWAYMSNVTSTPTILINSRILTGPYSYLDLKFHVKHLAEHSIQYV